MRVVLRADFDPSPLNNLRAEIFLIRVCVPALYGQRARTHTLNMHQPLRGKRLMVENVRDRQFMDEDDPHSRKARHLFRRELLLLLLLYSATYWLCPFGLVRIYSNATNGI